VAVTHVDRRHRVAIHLRSHRCHSSKSGRELTLVCEAQSASDLNQRKVRLHEKRPRKLDAHLNNVLTWRQARRLLELAVKMEWTDGSSSSEIYKSNRVADVRLDEVDNAAHLVAGQCGFRQIYVRSKRSVDGKTTSAKHIRCCVCAAVSAISICAAAAIARVSRGLLCTSFRPEMWALVTSAKSS